MGYILLLFILTEALGVANIAEILWSADSLGLDCDLDYLVSFLENHNQQP